MYVLRIEHPETGFGPYVDTPESFDDASWELLLSITNPHEESDAHPSMRRMSPTLYATDFYYGVPLEDFFCGFENKEQAWAWFGRADLELLKDLGFVLLGFETKGRVLRDGKQVAFQKFSSKLVDYNRWDLIDIS